MARQRSESISNAFTARRRWGEFFLTSQGSLIGAIGLNGRDPDGLLSPDHLVLAQITRTIYANLNRSITVSQYYAHFEGAAIRLRPARIGSRIISPPSAPGA